MKLRLILCLIMTIFSFCHAQNTLELRSMPTGELLDLPIDGSKIIEEIDATSGIESIFIGLAHDTTAIAVLKNPSGITVLPTISEIDTVSTKTQYKISNPDSGTWIMELSGSGIDDEHAYLEVFLNGLTPQMALLVDYGQIATIPATISVALFEGENPIQGADVELSLWNTNTNLTTTLIAVDNGNTLNGDKSVGDGLYSASELLEPGFYYINATAIIPANSTPLVDSEMMEVFPESAKITGTVTDEAVDTNQDGLFDKIILQFPIESVTHPGEYSVSALITASNGSSIYTRNGYTELNSNSTTISTELNLDDVKEKLGIDGPYEITDVRFMWEASESLSISMPHIIQFYESLGQTNPYNLNGFSRPYLTFTGLISDEGIDTNANGQFDFIQVKFGVNSLMTGDYFFEWNAELIPIDGLPEDGRAAFAVNNGAISEGFNELTLEFSVEEYGVNGISGPFIIDNLTIYPRRSLPSPYNDLSSSQLRDFPETFGPTQNYSAFVLEGGLPSDIPSLIEYIQSMTIDKQGNAGNAIQNTLIGDLEKIQESINSGKFNQAGNKLNAFLNKINAQESKAINSEDAEVIRQSVDFIKNTF